MQPSLIAVVVDLVFLAFLGLCAVLGWRSGFGRSRAALIGCFLGLVVAYVVTAGLAALSADSITTSVVGALACLLFAAGGYLAGTSVARIRSTRAGRSALTSTPSNHQPISATTAPTPLDRVAGTLAFTIVGLLVSAMIVLASSHVGTSVATQSFAIRITHAIVPSAISDTYAAMRNTHRDANLVRLSATHTAVVSTTSAAPFDLDAANGIAPAIVRISGTAWQCGQGLWGTGIIVAPERVLTNAHVVAGTNEVIVEAQGGPLIRGDIVYFDAQHDLAVIAVAGLSAPPIEFDDSHALEHGAMIAGFPYGGAFSTSSAVVTEHRSAESTDIYGHGHVRLDYWTILGGVPPGVSGGPLITSTGEVAGLVFASSETSREIGFALTLEHLLPVIERAAGYIIKVEAGPCLQH